MPFIAKTPNMPPLDPTRRPTSSFRTRPGVRVLLIAMVAFVSGCGYMIGGNYPPEIRSVHVPIFANKSDRRGLEFLITEAVQREMQKRTPFVLAKESNADTQLLGTISSARKSVMGKSRNDDPRLLGLRLNVTVTWHDINTDRVLSEHTIDIPPELVSLAPDASFAPEVGQSLATATQQAVDELARDIVSRMEAPW